MKRLVIAFTVLVGLCGCVKENPKGADLKVGEMMPDFEVVMSDGTVVTDDLLKESVSVVMFFSTACKDCRETLPQMQRIHDEYALKDVGFALVSRAESKASIMSFWKESSLGMPYSAQNDRTVYELFAKEGIPRVYICEKGGIIRYIHTDNPNPSYDILKNSIESVIR